MCAGLDEGDSDFQEGRTRVISDKGGGGVDISLLDLWYFIISNY